jgi:hypothetical protein
MALVAVQNSAGASVEVKDSSEKDRGDLYRDEVVDSGERCRSSGSGRRPRPGRSHEELVLAVGAGKAAARERRFVR